jgi:hypothetical protein
VPSGDEILFLKRELDQRTDDDMLLTVRNWVARFGTGHLSNEDKECSGRLLSDNSRKRGCHSFHDPGLMKMSAKKLVEPWQYP